MLGLLSFRTKATRTRIVKDREGEEDEDCGDDGWVHGGKYVPVPEGGARPPRSATNVDERGGGATAATSPYSMLSPPALGTPLPPEPATNPAFDVAFERGTDGSASRTRTPYHKARVPTPMTEQLRRLLEPTPAPARIADPPSSTPAGSAAGSTPSSASRETSTPVDLTPMGQFLQESGVPVAASHTIGHAASRVSSRSFGAFAAAWNYGVSWCNKEVIGNDLVPDVVESLVDLAAVACRFLSATLRFLAPFLLWASKMLIALMILIGGTLAQGLLVMIKGKKLKRAKCSGAVIVHSAMKSLRKSVRNSPFRRSGGRERLPFSGFSGGFKAPSPAASAPCDERPLQQKPAACSKLTPPVSAMRSNRTKQRTPAIDRDGTPATTTPATARRVLFLKDSRLTELHHFDKNMPAAGGAALSSDVSGSNVVNSDECRTESPKAKGDCKENTMEPDSNDSIEEKAPLTPTNIVGRPVGTAPAKSPTQFPHKDGVGNKEQNMTEEERKRQQHQHYVQRYGLLPTITPLSKRYARMKQQRQQKPLSLSNGPCTETASAATAAELGAANASRHRINVKRKCRGDLLGAASRMGRNRRARLGSNMPTVFLGESRIKRHRNEGQSSFMDEWVWRAMNHDGKENQKNIFTEESALKRGKFASVTKGGPDSTSPSGNVVGTPTKGNPTSLLLASVMTPPKTPGPQTSRFVDLGHATPGSRKTSELEVCAQTPGKPFIPTFDAVKKGAGNEGGPTFGRGAEGPAEAVKGSGAARGGLGFSGAVKAPENKSEAVASVSPGFSFVASTAATATGEKGAANKPALSVDNNNIGGASTFPTGDGTGFAQPEPRQGTTFAFGKTASGAESEMGAKSKDAASTASLSAVFSFEKPISADSGATMAPTSNAAAAAPAIRVLSFGPSAEDGTTVTPVTASASTAHASMAFSFVPSSQPSASSGNTFSFGTTTTSLPPNFGSAPMGSTFSVGGSAGGTGGAGARRRAAKTSGRRR